MATILAYTSPAFGNLYPILALLAELQGRGHRIVVKTLADGVATATDLGFESSAIDRRIETTVMTDWMEPNGRAALKAAFGVFGQRATFEVGDLREAISAVQPDALVVDANCWGATAAADAGSVPWLSFWPYTPYVAPVAACSTFSVSLKLGNGQRILRTTTRYTPSEALMLEAHAGT